MRFAKKVVIAVNMDTDMDEQFKPLKYLALLDECEIHIVHVFPTISYAMGLSEYPLIYPIKADQELIEKSVLSKLANFAKELIPQHSEGRVITKCLFNDDPKWKFAQYVQDTHADLIIVSAREKKGFFENSFTQYVNKHSSVNTIILKHKTKGA